MAISKGFAFRGIQDCKVAPLTNDGSSSLTYGSLLDVPIKDFSITPQIDTYELKHDDMLQDLDQQVQAYEIKGTMGRVALDVLAMFTGGSLTAAGTTPNQTQTYSHEYNDVPEYFKLEVMSNRTMGSSGSDIKDMHILFPKCKVMSFDYNIADDFATINFTAKAIRTINNGKLIQIVGNETAVAIS